MELKIEHLVKSFGGAPVVDDVSVTVEAGCPLVLLGPSGSGKTTLLRMICGVEAPTAGRIWLNGEDLTDVPPNRRDVAVVFQQSALLPQRTVAENLAYPLLVKKGWLAPLRRWRSIPKELQNIVEERSEKLGIRHLLERAPATLSGGELQRVALGRALIRGARTLLLDEPLSNIDVQLRHEFRMDVLHLVDEMRNAEGKVAPIVIWVTHDREDAFMLADSLGILVEGKLLQIGKADEVYAKPATRQIAQLTGWPPLSFLRAVVRRSAGQCQIDFAGSGTIHLAGDALPLGVEGDVTVGAPPKAIVLTKAGPLRARVFRRRIVGEEVHVLLDTPVGSLSAIVRADDHHLGTEYVTVGFKTDLLHFFESDDKGGRALQ